VDAQHQHSCQQGITDLFLPHNSFG